MCLSGPGNVDVATVSGNKARNLISGCPLNPGPNQSDFICSRKSPSQYGACVALRWVLGTVVRAIGGWSGLCGSRKGEGRGDDQCQD